MFDADMWGCSGVGNMESKRGYLGRQCFLVNAVVDDTIAQRLLQKAFFGMMISFKNVTKAGSPFRDKDVFQKACKASELPNQKGQTP